MVSRSPAGESGASARAARPPKRSRAECSCRARACGLVAGRGWTSCGGSAGTDGGTDGGADGGADASAYHQQDRFDSWSTWARPLAEAGAQMSRAGSSGARPPWELRDPEPAGDWGWIRHVQQQCQFLMGTGSTFGIACSRPRRMPASIPLCPSLRPGCAERRRSVNPSLPPSREFGELPASMKQHPTFPLRPSAPQVHGEVLPFLLYD